MSGTLIVTGHASTCCTADLIRYLSWHAHDANNYSWATRSRSTRMVACTTPRSRRRSRGRPSTRRRSACRGSARGVGPLKRFGNGGRNLVGVFGHGDVTSERNEHDPGAIIFDLLEARGFERFDFSAGEDLEVWARRQEWLRSLGVYDGRIDGNRGERHDGGAEAARVSRWNLRAVARARGEAAEAVDATLVERRLCTDQPIAMA